MQRMGNWCAITRRTYQTEESASVRTVCGKYANLSSPSKRSIPNCPDCHDILLVAIDAIEGRLS
jgi:hypothetical protein